MTPTAEPFTSRADLHVHTKYSDRPSEWILRRVGSPECFVEPRHVYDQARAAGMDFITISDHNKIDGALEIAHLPDTFISNEITTYFPENGAKMHVLSTGITEQQFKMIQELRTNIYELRQYFLDENIIYSVAHPLFLVNERLTVDQFEKLLVLFNRFEVINGTRDPRASRLVEKILTALTPQFIEKLANKHGIEPIGLHPHKKMMTGGSDDHSGIYVASGHTVTPRANNVDEFLDHLRQGRHDAAGHSGNSIHLAHCFYSIAYDFYKDRLVGKGGAGSSLLGEMFKRLLEPATQSPRLNGGPWSVRGMIESWVWKRKKKQLSETEVMIVEECTHLFANKTPIHGHTDRVGPTAVDAFETSAKLAHHLGYAFGQRFLNKVRSGNLIKSIEALAALGPVAIAIAPYLAAFATQHKDERFMQRIAAHFPVTRAMKWRSPRRAWITDTFDQDNEVGQTIHTLAEAAHRSDRPLTVISCSPQTPRVQFDLKNFEPVGMFGLPEYPSQKAAFPPFLEVIEYIERRRFGELIISTPGPMGLVALAAAKLMKLRTVGVYHTDFPNILKHVTEDDKLEGVAWKYMHWFYSQCDTILVPSDYYRRNLIEHGFDPQRIRVLRRGVDLGRFSPSRRDVNFWREYGGQPEAFTYLYVGRITSEKNIELLLRAFEKIRAAKPHVQLALVGDGPMLPALRKRYKSDSGVILTGFVTGTELTAAYPSSDAFVFPSTSDTFGSAVLEAQACGLPAVVTDRGGPQEIVRLNESGLVVDVDDNLQAADRFAAAMSQLADDAELRTRLQQQALVTARQSGWASVLQTLWNDHLHGSETPTSTQHPTRASGAFEEATT